MALLKPEDSAFEEGERCASCGKRTWRVLVLAMATLGVCRSCALGLMAEMAKELQEELREVRHG